MTTPKLDHRIASAEGHAQSMGRVAAKAERGRDAAQADNKRLRALLEDARQWARRGYELGQRSGTWASEKAEPAWLTQGVPPMSTEEME